MPTTVIKNGTIVTADLTYKADVQIEDGRDRRRSGRTCPATTVLDATGCYVMPGGIDPHTHLEMPFMGTYSTDDFESGTRAALAGGTTMVVDFACPIARPVAARSHPDVGQQVDARQLRLFLPHGDHLVGRAGLQRDGDRGQEKGINTFKHFMAYKGALMVNDDEMYRLVPALRRARRACRWSMPRTATSSPRCRPSCWPRATTGRRRHAYSRPPRGRGRGDQPRHHDRRHGRRAALCRAHLLRAGARGDPPRPPEGHARLWRAADPAPDARRERIFRQGLGPCRPPRDVARPSATSSTRIRSGPACRRARCRWSRPTIAPSPPSRSAMASAISPRSRTAPAALEDRMPMLWTYGVGTGRLTLNEFVAVTSTNIAKILNIYPKKGAVAGRRRRRSRRLGPEQGKDDLGHDAAVGDRLQRLRGQEGEGPAALHADPRRASRSRTANVKTAGRPRQVRRPRTLHRGQPGAVDLEGTDRAAQGRAHRHSGERGLMNTALPTGRSAKADATDPSAAGRGEQASPVTVIETSGLDLTFQTTDGPVHALSGIDLDRDGRVRLLHRPVGLRQDHAPARHCRAGNPTGGSILVNGMTPENARARAAPMAMSSRRPRLYPWRTIADERLAAAGDHGLSRRERERRVAQRISNWST